MRPESLEQALAGLAESEDAIILAGGQSLVAALNLRLQAPEVVIDINHISGLDGVEEVDGTVRVGALVRHATLLAHSQTSRALPLIAAALPHVAHPAIRNRGTICGSLAYADPAAEMPACAISLDASLVLRNAEGTRALPARDFYHGLYETERAPEELLVEARFPVAPEGARAIFAEVATRRGDFAVIGLAGQLCIEDGHITAFDLVAFGSEPAPLLLTDLGAMAVGATPGASLLRDLAEAVADGVDPMESPYATPQMRRRQYRALARSCLGEAMEVADV